MSQQITNRSSRIQGVLQLPYETLYVGIDGGKYSHYAGFVSRTLLQRHERFEGCPALMFAQSREGFRALIDHISEMVPLAQVTVLLEHTGHYHRALVQYLQELDVPVYVMPVQKRPPGLLKSDKRDALSLAIHLYNQLELGSQSRDPAHLVRRLLPPPDAAQQLKGWMRHRYELVRECTQRKNKLTAICDELFPEFTSILKDPNGATALALRKQFPTPQSLATAPFAELAALRQGRGRPSNAQLVELQRLARQSIGVKELVRQRGLVLEQRQLVRELQLWQEHIHELETEILAVVMQAREGRILTSIPGIGPIAAAAILAAIGNILNFETAAQLKAYCGWAPEVASSGVSLDHASLTPHGSRQLRQMFYLIVGQAIRREENAWARLYARLVPVKCAFDERRRAYRGTVKVVGRIAGQMIEMIYALLKQDAEIVSRVPLGVEPPEPICYDPKVHQRHINGGYHPLKNSQPDRKLIRLPPAHERAT
jgi:transposase